MYCFRIGLTNHLTVEIGFLMASLFDPIYAFSAEKYKMDYLALIYYYCYWLCLCCIVYTIETVMMLRRLFASTFGLCLIGLDTFYQYHNHFPIPVPRCCRSDTLCLCHNFCRNWHAMRFVHDLRCGETMLRSLYLVSILSHHTDQLMNRSLNHCKLTR